MGKINCNTYFFVCSFFTFVACAFSDTIELYNDSKFEGKFLLLENQKVFFHIPKVQTVEVPFQSIKSMDINQVVYSYLDDKRIVSGKLSLNNDEGIIRVFFPPVDSSSGIVEFEKDQLKKIDFQKPSEVRHVWSGGVLFGGQYFTGNTIKKGMDLEVSGNLDIYHHEVLKNELDLYAWFDFLRTNGRLVSNDGGELVVFTHHLTPRINWFALEQVGYDKTEDLDLRTQVQLGIGWIFLNFSKFKVSLLNGIVRLDSFYKDNTRSHDGFFGYAPGVKIWGKHKLFEFKSISDAKANIKNFSEYIFYSDSRLSFPLSHCQAFLLRFELKYNSRPPPNILKMDTRTSLNFAYNY